MFLSIGRGYRFGLARPGYPGKCSEEIGGGEVYWRGWVCCPGKGVVLVVYEECAQERALEICGGVVLQVLHGCLSNLCEYFVSIHGQHKIRGIRDASSSSFSRSSLI